MFRLLTALFLLLPTAAWCAPHEVTLFPQTALVQELTKVTLQQAGAGFSSCDIALSGQADPATLRFGALPDKLMLADTTWTSGQTPDLAALEPLNVRLKELQDNRLQISAELEGTQGRIAFWKAQSSPQQQNIEALKALAAELGTMLRTDTAAALELERKRADLDKQIAQIQEKIDQITGNVKTVWQVRLLFSGSSDKPVELRYSYSVNECGWTPLYRLDAQPDSNKVDFSWQAKVWQRSGQDWNGVKLHLATLQPQGEAAPPELRAWQIIPQPIEVFKTMRAAPAAAPMEARADLTAAAAPQPLEIQKGTYAEWDMGERTIPAGDPRVLEIERQSWPATFRYVIRPSVSPKAFLQAHAVFEKPKDMPSGNALFLMNGAGVGERKLTLSGKEADLFFGSNPMLACTTTLKDKKTGEAGIIAQKQTFSRTWSVTVKNTGTRPAAVRVEEPRPLARDERIKLDVSAEPKPLEEKNPELLAWNSTVGAGAESTISMTVNFEAPEDLRINPGWRW